jgi:hypothetical protein
MCIMVELRRDADFIPWVVFTLVSVRCNVYHATIHTSVTVFCEGGASVYNQV